MALRAESSLKASILSSFDCLEWYHHQQHGAKVRSWKGDCQLAASATLLRRAPYKAARPMRGESGIGASRESEV
jgi:hypothetical protein